MLGYEKDKAWSDRFLVEIKRTLGEYLISEAPVEEDQICNTDLVVLSAAPYRVACRIRRHEYIQRYGNEFTIREGRPSGVKTELAKIVEGWGDYLFYGFSDTNEQCIERWMLGDLKIFRLWFMRHLITGHGTPPGRGKPNQDGSSSFRAYDITSLPPEFIVASNWKTHETISLFP